jgi:hypothetical protein
MSKGGHAPRRLTGTSKGGPARRLKGHVFGQRQDPAGYGASRGFGTLIAQAAILLGLTIAVVAAVPTAVSAQDGPSVCQYRHVTVRYRIHAELHVLFCPTAVAMICIAASTYV